MPAYHYIALSQEQKELSGVIEAPSEVAARKKLNDLGLSVVSLNTTEAPPHVDGTNVQRFEFEAIDRNGKKVVGTIAAQSPVSAYARLFEEYQLNITALFSANLAEADKAAARDIGILHLQQEFEKIYKKTSAKGQLDQAEESPERSELMRKVNFTMQRIEQFLEMFQSELKPEERDAIRAYINQLIRIKDSTNLDHIRSTCEKMLDHVQRQELFLHEDNRRREMTKLKAETQDMLTELKHTGIKQEIDVVKIIKGGRDAPIIGKAITWLLKLLNADDPELLTIKDEINLINKQIWTYIKILISPKSKNLRSEAWSSIGSLRAEKQRLKIQYAAIKDSRKASIPHIEVPHDVPSNLESALGWISGVYVALYLITYPMTIKKVGGIELPTSLHFYDSPFLEGLTIFFFMAYAVTAIRRYWLSMSWVAPYIIYPSTFVLYLFLTVNLIK